MAQQMLCISAPQHLNERQYRFHFIIHKPATTFQQSRHFFSRFLRRGKREKSIKGTAGRTVPPPRKGRQTSRPTVVVSERSVTRGKKEGETTGPETKKRREKREKKETGEDGGEVGGRGTSMSTVTANTQDDVSYFCDFCFDFFFCFTFTDETDID